MASFIEPPQTTDPLELLRHFQREAERRETPKTELPKGILERPSEEVDDKSYGVMKFFADWWSGTENKVAEARKEVLEGLVNMPMPTLPTPTSEALDATLPGRESEPVIEGVAPDKPSMLTPEAPDLDVDTRSNEALDKSNQTMSKAIEDVLETVVDSDVSDSTDSADGGAAPSDGKGIMSPKALTDDDMGLPDERGNTEQVLNTQKKLTNLGFDPKGIDGEVGPGTKRALRKFQKANDLPITGELTSDVIRILDSDKAEAYFDPPKLDAKVDNIPDSEFDVFKEAIAQKESSGRYSTYDVDIPKLGIKKGDPLYGGSNKHYLGRYQMGKDALKDVGRGYNKTLNQAFLDNPDLQDKLFKKFTLRNHKALTKTSGIYRDMSIREKLGVLGYAHNQGVGAAEEWLYTGVSGKDGFGTLGDEYTTLIADAFANQSSDLAPKTSIRPKARPTD